jgi:2-oxoglutarate/2-oxoacid ferredoxin oxidoreductase subunit alpha
MNEISIRITGEAGQGMQTVGMALCSLCARVGLHFFAHQDYMSRVRGGNNYFQVRVSRDPVYALRAKADIIVALDAQSVALHRGARSTGGLIVADGKKFGLAAPDADIADVPLYEIAQQAGASDLYVNSAAFGAVAGMMKVDSALVQDIIRSAFADKAEEITGKNIAAAAAGYAAGQAYSDERFVVASGKNKSTFIINGNDAIALGALRAGVKFYAAYPMTPSTSIMTTFAHYASEYGAVVEQAEDEISAVNMVIGASYAGARAMTGTSGGGFALMIEGISLAGMMETPLVVVDAQRPAPATGFPTRTEQADLEMLIHAGHGEFARAVFAPGTAEEAYTLTVYAFNLAEKYQIPVMIMTDQHLADSIRDTGIFDPLQARVSRSIISKEDSTRVAGYKRYALTDTGISPRAIPGWISDVIYADSDEHSEEGHITEDAQMRIKMVNKRFFLKMAALQKEAIAPVAYRCSDADVVLVGFGSTYGVIREAVDVLRDRVKIGCVHLPQVWPFPPQAADILRGVKTALTVENNASGQLARLIRRETGLNVSGSVLKYDGRPFDIDGLIAQLDRAIA